LSEPEPAGDFSERQRKKHCVSQLIVNSLQFYRLQTQKKPIYSMLV